MDLTNKELRSFKDVIGYIFSHRGEGALTEDVVRDVDNIYHRCKHIVEVRNKIEWGVENESR